MRVEQALSAMPDLEVLFPLRALILSCAVGPHSTWALSGQNHTVGKRDVSPAQVRDRVNAESARVAAHVSGLYDRYVRALECIESGDAASAVSCLLDAGTVEEAAGRLAQARAWVASALALAEGLPVRRPEIQALLSVGRLSVSIGDCDDAARRHQRAFVLAEAEFDHPGAIDACEGLAIVAVEQGAWSGAQAWYSRGLRLAEAAADRLRVGRLHLGLGELARHRANLAVATDELRLAREQFEDLGEARQIALVLTTQAQVEADAGLALRAANAYREALAWAHRAPSDPGLEALIRLNLARLLIETQRFLEAEEELRRAEQLAVTASDIRLLAQIYAMFGRLRGRQGDESGFVFFEQAIQLARMLDRFPVVEAQVYHEYAMFKGAMGQPDESRAYLERSRDIFESVGSSEELERVRTELQRIPA